jgi:hypothetical protein
MNGCEMLEEDFIFSTNQYGLPLYAAIVLNQEGK